MHFLASGDKAKPFREAKANLGARCQIRSSACATLTLSRRSCFSVVLHQTLRYILHIHVTKIAPATVANSQISGPKGPNVARSKDLLQMYGALSTPHHRLIIRLAPSRIYS